MIKSRNFLRLTSGNLSLGFRITLATVFPVFWGYFTNNWGVAVPWALGALALGLSDSPGVLKDRLIWLLRNLALLSITIFITGLFTQSYWLLVVWMVFGAFLWAMVAVFGNRFAVMGNAMLIGACYIMATQKDFAGTVHWTEWMSIGGFGYILVSLFLGRVGRYKGAEESLRNAFVSLSKFTLLRSTQFTADPAADHLILAQRVKVIEDLATCRTELFDRRKGLKGGTKRARKLGMIVWHMVDTFEMLSASHTDLQQLQKDLGESDIICKIHKILKCYGQELQRMSESLPVGAVHTTHHDQQEHLNYLDIEIQQVKELSLDHFPVASFTALKNIMRNLTEINWRLNRMTKISQGDISLEKEEIDFKVFASEYNHQERILSELNIRSPFYRHAIRLSLAILLSMAIGHFLGMEQVYWIVLTVIVIMKPNFSETKKRTFERFLGTVLGCGIASVILFFFQGNAVVMLFFLTLLSLLSFFWLGKNYGFGVLFLTPFVLVLFSFIDTQAIHLVGIRFYDTVLGSVIAFLLNYLFLPNFQRLSIIDHVQHSILTMRKYLESVSSYFTEEEAQRLNYKIDRKSAHLAQSQLNVSFNQMLTEPKSKQIYGEEIYAMVIQSANLMTSIATLSIYAERMGNKYAEDLGLAEVRRLVLRAFDDALLILKGWKKYEDDRQVDQVFEQMAKGLKCVEEIRMREMKAGEWSSPNQEKLADLQLLNDQWGSIYRQAVEIKKKSQALSES